MRRFVVAVLLGLGVSCLVSAAARAAETRDVATFKQAGDFIIRADGKALMLSGGAQRSASFVDLKTGKAGKSVLLLTPDKAKQPNFVTADPTGQFVVAARTTAGKPGVVTTAITTFDATTGKELGSLTVETMFVVAPGALAATPDGKTVVACLSGEVQLFDAVTGKASETIKVPKSASVSNPSVSRDGKWLCVASSQDNGALLVYDLAKRELKHTLGVTGSVFRDATFSPDGKFLVSRSEPGRLVTKAVATVWNLETGAAVRSFDAGNTKGKRFGVMAFDKDSAVLAVDENDGVILFDGASGKKLGLVKLPLVEDPAVKKLMRPSRLTFSPDGTLLAVVYDRAQLAKVYDVSELIGK